MNIRVCMATRLRTPCGQTETATPTVGGGLEIAAATEEADALDQPKLRQAGDQVTIDQAAPGDQRLGVAGDVGRLAVGVRDPVLGDAAPGSP